MPSTHFVSVQQSPDVDTHFSGRTSNSSGSVSHDAPLVLFEENPERRQAAGRREVALAHYDVEGGPSRGVVVLDGYVQLAECLGGYRRRSPAGERADFGSSRTG